MVIHYFKECILVMNKTNKLQRKLALRLYDLIQREFSSIHLHHTQIYYAKHVCEM